MAGGASTPLASQRHTPSSLAAVIGISNNDVITLRSFRALGPTLVTLRRYVKRSLRCVSCVGWKPRFIWHFKMHVDNPIKINLLNCPMLFWNSLLISIGVSTKMIKILLIQMNYYLLLSQCVLTHKMKTKFINWICVIKIFTIMFALKNRWKMFIRYLMLQFTPPIPKWFGAGRRKQTFVLISFPVRESWNSVANKIACWISIYPTGVLCLVFLPYDSVVSGLLLMFTRLI